MNFYALKHFYFMNNVRINKEKIGKFLGESKKKNVDRSYTHAEIKSMVDIADLRFKVVISVLANWHTYRSLCPHSDYPIYQNR